ncbi:MAG: class I SAM-dependent methyltransferase, partial [Armatimonadetes bacterium CG_4_9_14_3_um_filter_66_14]
MSNLPFTGERFTPECVREMWYEHYHRYAFARALVAGKSVADIACGEGYGAALLAQSASSVVGIDLSAEAINHAQQRYAAQTNLR